MSTKTRGSLFGGYNVTTDVFVRICMAIAEKIKDTVKYEKIYLFSSYAYGEPHKDSDLDFYVVLPDDSVLRPIEAIRKIRRSLGHTKLIMPVDIIAGRLSRFGGMSKLPTMERRIAREGIVLYERLPQADPPK